MANLPRRALCAERGERGEPTWAWLRGVAARGTRILLACHFCRLGVHVTCLPPPSAAQVPRLPGQPAHALLLAQGPPGGAAQRPAALGLHPRAGLQPYVLGTATVCDRACNRINISTALPSRRQPTPGPTSALPCPAPPLPLEPHTTRRPPSSLYPSLPFAYLAQGSLVGVMTSMFPAQLVIRAAGANAQLEP